MRLATTAWTEAKGKLSEKAFSAGFDVLYRLLTAPASEKQGIA